MGFSDLYVTRRTRKNHPLLADDVPDHSVLSRFRTRLTEARAWDSLLDAVNRQFDLHGVNLKRGVHADKAYPSELHNVLLKSLQLKNGIQDKAVRGKPLSTRQRQRNTLITKVRYVVERTFGNQVIWFGSKVLRYCGLAKAHAWHVLQAMAYNMKRLPNLLSAG